MPTKELLKLFHNKGLSYGKVIRNVTPWPWITDLLEEEILSEREFSSLRHACLEKKEEPDRVNGFLLYIVEKKTVEKREKFVEVLICTHQDRDLARPHSSKKTATAGNLAKSLGATTATTSQHSATMPGKTEGNAKKASSGNSSVTRQLAKLSDNASTSSSGHLQGGGHPVSEGQTSKPDSKQHRECNKKDKTTTQSDLPASSSSKSDKDLEDAKSEAEGRTQKLADMAASAANSSTADTTPHRDEAVSLLRDDDEDDYSDLDSYAFDDDEGLQDSDDLADAIAGDDWDDFDYDYSEPQNDSDDMFGSNSDHEESETDFDQMDYIASPGDDADGCDDFDFDL